MNKKLPNKIQLITYPDSLGRDLKELRVVLNNYFKSVIKGVHILPFYLSSGDRGFSPLTHLKVDEKFGTWEDIRLITKEYDVVCDLMVNHISVKSKYFKDYLKKGENSKYADYFITAEKFSGRIKKKGKTTSKIVFFIENFINKLRAVDFIFHERGVNRFSIKKIYRPRPGNPFVKFLLANGKVKNIWCTFSRDQVDLDINNNEVKNILKESIALFAINGIKMVRLDAIGYVAKDRGTKSFMIPETYRFIEWISAVAEKRGVLSLPEVHSYYKDQLKLAKISGVDYVYDFVLPILVLYSLYTGSNKKLKNWIAIRPDNQITTLDTHDGLPVVDVEGIMTDEERSYVTSLINLHGGNAALRASGNNSRNVDVYQINCTYYSALGENDDAYITARAIQFFIPGVPQVYYMGLLAGRNDVEKLNLTGVGRDINRHNYTMKEIKEELRRPVVKRLMNLMDFRNNYSAFGGEFEMKKNSGDKNLVFKWKEGEMICKIKINLEKYIVEIRYIDPQTLKEKFIKA